MRDEVIDLNRLYRSESESGEEEFSVAGLFSLLGVSVCLSEFLSNGFSESFSAFLGLETFVLDFSKVKLINNESGRHHVVLVDISDEGLDSSSFDEFLLVIVSFDLDKIATDSCD
jgi:hypothetical protein